MGTVAGQSADVRYSLLAAMIRRFDSLTLKMKVKDVKDLNENWQTKLPCQHAYVCKNCCTLVQPFNRGTIMIWMKIGRRTYFVNMRMYEYFEWL